MVLSKQSDNMSVELNFQQLEIGNLGEKHAALSALRNDAKNNMALDLKRLVFCLMHVDDPELIFSVYSLLTYLALKDEENRKQLIEILDIYIFAKNLFINGSNKKVNGALNLFAAMVHSKDNTVSSKLSNCLCKTMIRTSGCLGQMCKLFLQSNAFNQCWKSLCFCLAECCFDEPENKESSSHILSKCLREFTDGYKLELVMLTRAVIENFPLNQEKFVRFGGIVLLARNLLDQPDMIELLCVAITDCKMAVNEAQRCNLRSLVEHIQFRTSTDSKMAKWCRVALWKLNYKCTSTNTKCTPRIDLPNVNDCIDTKAKFSAMIKTVSDASVCKTFIPKLHTEDKKQSCISKFDAISTCTIDNNNSNEDINSNSAYVSAKRSILDTSFLVPETSTKFLNTKNIQYSRVSKQKTNSETFRNGNYSEKNHNYRWERDQTPENFELMELDQYSEFRPKYRSSPKRMENITTINGSYFIPDATKKRGYGHFGKLDKVIRSNVKDDLKNTEGSLIFTNDDEIDHDVTLKCDENPSTSFKVRKLARNILDYEKKEHNAGNDASFLHMLSPDKDNKLHVKSIPKIKTMFADNCKAVSTSQNSIDSFKCDNKLCNITCIDDVKHDYSEAKQDKEAKGCLSLEERFPVDILSSVNHEITSAELNNTISFLKMGVSLYGCNFQKISQLLWPKDNVSPVVLYEIFRLHIMK